MTQPNHAYVSAAFERRWRDEIEIRKAISSTRRPTKAEKVIAARFYVQGRADALREGNEV